MIRWARIGRGMGTFGVAVVLLAAMLSVGRAGAQPVVTPRSSVFGIVEGMWLPDLTCQLNPGWERLIFDWAQHQPSGPEDWNAPFVIPDAWLQAASRCGREVVAVVKSTPPWATDGSDGTGVPRGLDLPIDDPGNLWANFMRRAAAYYGPKGVDTFIIWNEPDIAAGTYGYEFEGDLEDYVRMVKVAYLAARQGNPSARIHLAGTTYWHDINSGSRLYTDRLLERLSQDPDGAANGYYFDALSLHIYFRTDTVYDIVGVYRGLLNRYGFNDKAIWINETNASPNRDPNWPVTRPQFQISLDQQAAFVVQAAALGLAAGAERIAVYKLWDQSLPGGAESFGLLNPQSQAPRPGFYAWQTVIRYFNGAVGASLAQTEQADAVRLTMVNDQYVYVLWARTGAPVQFEIGATSDKAYLISQTGEVSLVDPQGGVYLVDAPPANCEQAEGCVVGGNVWLLIQPAGQSTVTQIVDGARTVLSF